MVLEQFIIDADIIWDQVGKTFFENPEAKAGRIMRVQVVNAGIVEDLAGYTLNLGWTSVRDPSKFGLDAFDDVDITKGIFEIEYTSGMLTNIGPLNASLQLVPPGEGRPIESNNFKLTVKNSAINPEAIQGETSFSTLENALVEVNSWNTTIDGKVVAWEADMAATKQLYIDNMEEVEATYPQKLNSLSQQLEQAATKAEVSAIATPLAVSLVAQMTNVARIYVYTGSEVGYTSGNWYYHNGTAWVSGGVYQSTGLTDRSISAIKIADSSVDLYKLKDVIASQNLLNPDTLLTGYVASSSGITANASYTLSDFIEIYGGTQYTISYATALFVTYYDSAKNYLSSASLGTPATNYTFTVPANAAHMRLNIINTKKTDFMIVRGTVMPTQFVPYSFTLTNSEFEDGTIKISKLEIDLQEKMNLFYKSVNLLNPDTITTGMAITSSAGPSANADYDISDFIAVKPDTNYTLSGSVSVAAVFYNAAGTYLGSSPISGSNVTITSKPNSATMRINIHKNYKTNFMAIEGTTLPDYFIPFGNVVDKLVLEYDVVDYANLSESLKNAVNNRLSSKKIVTFGDSITDIDGDLFSANKSEAGQVIRGYQTHMRERLGCIIDNRGMNGMNMPNILTNRVLPYTGYADTDVVTLTSGANDHRLGTLPGVVLPPKSVFDETTFAGAMQRAIEYILTQNQNIKIFLLTPIKGWFTATVEARYKGEAVLSSEYVDIMFALAELYSLPILDWYHTSGINDLTYQINGVPYYIGDVPELVDPQDAYFVHPTNLGYERMADVLIPFLNNNY